MKPSRLFWLIPIILLSILLVIPGPALAELANQTDEITPTPKPLYPEDVDVPQTHFPGLIAGAVVIVIIILVGTLIRPKNS
ncbi:MAG: hypothetical protein ISR58_09320 [Anaerolineales bacterium]|nr:hypothetical protein [Chloroflexota bacterium]MBL6981376.1 hypothetical protein [Anaerolineales bacterium]